MTSALRINRLISPISKRPTSDELCLVLITICRGRHYKPLQTPCSTLLQGRQALFDGSPFDDGSAGDGVFGKNLKNVVHLRSTNSACRAGG